MKYMVVECHLSYAVVLSEDGRFLKVANLHYEIGQVVSHVVEMRQPERQPESGRRVPVRWITSMAAAAACLTLVAVAALRVGSLPYGTVYMEINPDVRIDVDRKDRVVGLEGMNRDGEALVEDYSYRRKDLELVVMSWWTGPSAWTISTRAGRSPSALPGTTASGWRAAARPCRSSWRSTWIRS